MIEGNSEKKGFQYKRIIYIQQEAHGPHHSPEKPVLINEYILAKL